MLIETGQFYIFDVWDKWCISRIATGKLIATGLESEDAAMWFIEAIRTKDSG